MPAVGSTQAALVPLAHPSPAHVHAHELRCGRVCRRLQISSGLDARLFQRRLRRCQLALCGLQLAGECCCCCLCLCTLCLALLLQEADVLGGGISALLGLLCRVVERKWRGW